MVIYLVESFTILVLGLLLKPQKNKQKLTNNSKLFFIITFLILFCVSGFRSKYVGVDTLQYYNAFMRISQININEFADFRYEYGFTFLCWVLSKIINTPQILIFVTSFFINLVILRYISKNSDNILASVLIYMFFIIKYSAGGIL